MTNRVMSAIVPFFRVRDEASLNASSHILELQIRPVLYGPATSANPPQKAILDGRQTLCDFHQSIFTPKTHPQGRVTPLQPLETSVRDKRRKYGKPRTHKDDHE